MKNTTNKKPDKKKNSNSSNSMLIWFAIIFFVIASFAFLPDESANEVEISYNSYKELLAENKIKSASIENDNSFLLCSLTGLLDGPILHRNRLPLSFFTCL